eukprot:209977_1
MKDAIGITFMIVEYCMQWLVTSDPVNGMIFDGDVVYRLVDAEKGTRSSQMRDHFNQAYGNVSKGPLVAMVKVLGRKRLFAMPKDKASLMAMAQQINHVMNKILGGLQLLNNRNRKPELRRLSILIPGFDALLEQYWNGGNSNSNSSHAPANRKWEQYNAAEQKERDQMELDARLPYNVVYPRASLSSVFGGNGHGNNNVNSASGYSIPNDPDTGDLNVMSGNVVLSPRKSPRWRKFDIQKRRLAAKWPR